MGLEILALPVMVIMWFWLVLPAFIGSVMYRRMETRARPFYLRVAASTTTTALVYWLPLVIMIAAHRSGPSPEPLVQAFAALFVVPMFIWVGVLWWMARHPRLQRA